MEDIDRMFRILMRRFQQEFREIQESIENILEREYATRCFNPLCNVEVGDEIVTVTFDIPGVEKENIDLRVSEDQIELDAVSKKKFKVKRWGLDEEEAEIKRYHKRISLPVKVNPSEARAKLRNGVLEVKIPLAKKGVRISID